MPFLFFHYAPAKAGEATVCPLRYLNRHFNNCYLCKELSEKS